MGPLRGGESFYTPDRVRLLLLSYGALSAAGSHALDGSGGSSRSEEPAPNPEGGFETRHCILADIQAALASLDPLIRKIIWLHYIAGYYTVEIVRGLRKTSWFVRTALIQGTYDMALFLGWRPRREETKERAGDRRDKLLDDLRLLVARAIAYCPTFGPPGCPCPVDRCRGWFASIPDLTLGFKEGQHVGPLLGRGALTP